MSFLFGGGDKRHRKRSSDQAGKSGIPQGWASQSAINLPNNPPPVRHGIHGHVQNSPPGQYLAPPLPSGPRSGNVYLQPPQQQNHANSSLNLPQQRQPRNVKSKMSLNRLNQAVGRASQSVSNLQDTLAGRGSASTTNLQQPSNCLDSSCNMLIKTTAAISSGAALCDIIQSKLNAVITSMDGEEFSGNEQDLIVYENQQTSPVSTSLPETSRAISKVQPGTSRGVGSNHFSKVWLYANSRLPPHMPPFKV